MAAGEQVSDSPTGWVARHIRRYLDSDGAKGLVVTDGFHVGGPFLNDGSTVGWQLKIDKTASNTNTFK